MTLQDQGTTDDTGAGSQKRERALAMHRRLGDAMRANPALFGRLTGALARYQSLVPGCNAVPMKEWEELLAKGMDATLAVATEDSSRGDCMKEDGKSISHAAYEAGSAHGEFVMPLVFSGADFDALVAGERRIVADILREGLVL